MSDKRFYAGYQCDHCKRSVSFSDTFEEWCPYCGKGDSGHPLYIPWYSKVRVEITRRRGWLSLLLGKESDMP